MNCSGQTGQIIYTENTKKHKKTKIMIFFLDYIFFSDTMSICQEGQKPPQTQIRPGFYHLTDLNQTRTKNQEVIQ